MKASQCAAIPAVFACLAVTGLGCSSAPEFDQPDEADQRFVNVNFSHPLAGLTAAQLADFEEGEDDFEEVETVEDGLGPVFNDRSCAACHDQSGVGGGSTRVETRWGNTVNGVFDPMASKGGSLQQSDAIGSVNKNGKFCTAYIPEAQPANSNTLAFRRATPLFGLGFVDATPDSRFASIAAAQPAAQRGRQNMVQNLDTGTVTMGKFGWKSGVPTLHVFSGDAYINEMGITNPQFPNESCPQGNCAQLSCNPLPTLNDDGSGVTNFTNFMKLLAAPPRASGFSNGTVSPGETVFNRLGCNTCHTKSITSGASSVAALANKTYFPFSDFLIHNMGTKADGIGGQGQAGPREMRTAPLWGLRGISRFMHNGVESTLGGAIEAHGDVSTGSQAASAVQGYRGLNTTDRNALFAFLNSL